MNTNISKNQSVYGNEVEDKPLSAREVRYLNVKRLTALIWMLSGILQGLLGIRILLKFIGANPESPFAGFVYAYTQPFLFLFEGLTNNPSFSNMVLELHVFFAIAFYALATWVLVRLIWLIFYRPEDIQ